MNLKDLKKDDLIKMIEEQQVPADYEKIKKQNELFLKGSREKDATIKNLEQQLNQVAINQQEVFKEVEQQTNQKIAQISQQQIAIASEYDFVKKGLVSSIETLDDILVIQNVQHETINKLVARLKAIYTEEE
jgi:hypothetical protein